MNIHIRVLALGLVTLSMVGCSIQIKPDGSFAKRSEPQQQRAFRENRSSEVERVVERDVPPPPVSEPVEPPPRDPNIGEPVPNPESAVVATTTPVPTPNRKEEVRKTILSRKLDFRACYNRTFGVERKKGEVVYEWDYNERGRIVNIKLVSSDFKRPKFERCVERVLKSTTFPKTDHELISRVRYPFHF